MAVSSPAVRQAGVRVSQLLPAAQSFGGIDPHVTSVTARLDAVRPGDVFVVLEGRHDALSDIREAVAAGAAVIVAEEMRPIFDVPQLVVDDAREAYAMICHALMGEPAEELKVVGIGGSHGKTSTSILLASILRAAGHAPSCFTNRVNLLGGEWQSMPASTDAASIAHNLAEAQVAGSEHAIVEVSETTLLNHQLSGVQLDVACLTNLYADNSPANVSPLECRQQMQRLLDHLAPHGVLVANVDDPDCQRLLATYDGAVVTFAQTRPAEIRGTVVEEHPGEVTFLLTIDGDTAVVRTPIVGSLHISNCLAAAAMATTYGIELIDIVRGLEAVAQLPGVMQRTATELEFAVYLDGSNSPESLRACLSGVRRTTTGRVIAVVPGQSTATHSVARALSDTPIDTAGWSELPARHSTRRARTGRAFSGQQTAASTSGSRCHSCAVGPAGGCRRRFRLTKSRRCKVAAERIGLDRTGAIHYCTPAIVANRSVAAHRGSGTASRSPPNNEVPQGAMLSFHRRLPVDCGVYGDQSSLGLEHMSLLVAITGSIAPGRCFAMERMSERRGDGQSVTPTSQRTRENRRSQRERRRL